MRCEWRVLPWVCALASSAYADPADPIVRGAMPSGVHVARAETLDRGVAVVEAGSGLGYRSGLLGSGHRLVRALANVSGAYGITPELAVGLSLDGYYDRHSGFPTGPSSGCGDTCEQGYVGAPHLSARYVRRTGGASVGAHLELWIPGDQLPSMKFGATSVELRGLAAFVAGPGTLALDAGFRLDNSHKTISDIESFTVPDRVSYGSSNYNAIVAGAHYAVRISPRLWVAGESSIVLFVGSPPANAADLEDGRWLARVGGSLGLTLTPQWNVVGFLDAVKSPGVDDAQAMDDNIPLIPYEPMITAGIALQARFGGADTPPAVIVQQPKEPPPCWDSPAGCKSEEEPLLGDIAGVVVDDAGKPLAGATVTITGKVTGTTATTTTKDDGSYAFQGVRIGKRTITPAKGGPTRTETVEETELELRVVADGRDPVVSTIAAPKPGANAVPSVTLQPTLPPGQLRGVVRSPRGVPIANATITVMPGDLTAVSATDGTFALDLPPGSYKVTVTAPGLKTQELEVTVDPNGVALKEFILSR